MADYTAIDCGLHSEFELAIMHEQWLSLSWKVPDEERQSMHVKPTDIYAKDKQEYLVMLDQQGETHTIRLDYITRQTS